MALSGSFNTSTGPYGCYFKFDWTATQDISGNKSTVTWTVTLQGSQIDVFSRKVSVNGAIQGYGYPYDGNYPQENHTIGWTAFSGTTVIPHSADGSGSFNVSMWANLYYSYPYLGYYNCTGSISFSLDTIPRNPWTTTGCTITNSQVVGQIVAGHSVSTFNVTTSRGDGDAPSIAKYRLYDSNNRLLKESNSNNFTYTVPFINSSTSSITYKVSAVDSYGMETNKYTCPAFTAKRYVQGSFTTDPTSRRYDTQEGQVDESIGKSALCEISFSNSTIGGSSITTTVRVEVNGSYGTTTSSPTSLIVGNDTLNGTSSYNVLYTLYDGVTSLANSTVQVTDIISVSFHTIHLHKDGHGIGFGVESSDGYVDVDNMEFRLNDGVSYGQMSAGFITGNHQDHGLYSYGYVDSNNQFHSDPMWLLKRDNTGAVTVAGGVETYTNLISRTSGLQRSSNTIKKSGNVVTATLVLSGDGADHYVGNNLFEGTMSSLRPATDVMGVGYYGNMVYIGWLKSNGDVIIRLSGYADHYTFSSGSPVVISWTYITN